MAKEKNELETNPELEANTNVEAPAETEANTEVEVNTETEVKTKTKKGSFVFGHDGKNREVIISTNGKTFTVSKPNLNAPISEVFKSEAKAFDYARQLVDDTSN